MKIAITGSTGMLGQYLVHQLREQDHDILRITRSHVNDFKEPAVNWDPEKQTLDLQPLEGTDVVIHLAGEAIGKRWSKEHKERIRNSRITGTSLLSKTLAQLKQPPRLLLSASAVGYYGNRPASELLDENSTKGSGFLSDLVTEWEQATSPAEEKGIRVVHMRFGVILAKHAGALKHLLIPFKLGFGGKIGTGRQVLSWVALEEISDIIQFLMDKEEIAGAINIVSPESVSNYRFTKTLGEVLGRPTFLPTPTLMLKLFFGEMADALLVEGNRVAPKKLERFGYTFQYPDLKQTLMHMLNN